LDRPASSCLKREQLIHLGRARTRIDLLTSISGVSREEDLSAKFRQSSMGFRSLSGKDAAIQNKRTTGRGQDLADLDMLKG
jgi:hypothetical protein